MFVEINGWSWNPRPTVDEAEQAMLAIASGDWDQHEMAQWLGKKLAARKPE